MSHRITFLSPIKWACLFAAFLVIPAILPAQESFPVKRGERPEIPVDKMTEEAIRPGYLRIKIDESFSDLMSEKFFSERIQKSMITGIPGLDELHAKSHIKSVKQSFSSSSGAIDQRYSERHRQWGFHLWLTIETSKSANIPALLKEYQKLKEVSFAEPVYRIEWIGADLELEEKLFLQHQNGVRDIKTEEEIPDDPRFEDQWHYHNTGQTGGTPGADISLLDAWKITKGDPRVLVAVIDGGVHFDHPDLVDNMWEGIGYNFVSDTSLIFMTRHGTHVAGTIAAKTNNNTGVAGVAGGWGEQPGVSLMTCQVFEPVTMGENVDAFHLAPIWAADQGAVISQNSWGYTRPNVYAQIELDAIDYFNAHGGGEVAKGGITISSAGNSDSNELYYPSSYSGALSVAATNHNDQKADYSNYGEQIDISAPGGESSDAGNQGVLSTVEYNYAYANGTSMACPHVSGVAALMLSAAPYEFTATQLLQMIKNAVDNHYAVNPDYLRELGTGRLNADKAVKAAQTNRRAPVNFEATQEGNVHALLSWEKNQYDDPVIVAVNTEPGFGIPTYNMQAGNPIPGGGTIIYAGHGESFIHYMPSSSQVYYSIWSSDNERNTVSFDRRAVVTKEPESINISHEELFSYASLPPGWTASTLNQGSGSNGTDPVLSLKRYSDKPAAFPSNGAFMVTFNSYEARQNAQSQLISPGFSTIGLSGLSFSIDWHKDTIKPNINDRVQIGLSRNLESWTNIGSITRAGSEMGWKRETFPIPSFFNNREEVHIRFVFISDRREQEAGGNMYLDVFNLMIAGEQITADFSVSKDEVREGERVYFYNKSTGQNISSLSWDFGEGASPRAATGEGPHVVRYTSGGKKSPALTLNGNVRADKSELIDVSPSSLAAPRQLTGSLAGTSDIRLDWTCEADKKEDQPILKGFNIYRNGHFYENINDPEARAYTDLNASQGYLHYFVTAFYGSAMNESAPTRELRMAVNGLPVTLSIDGNGEIDPAPGTHYYLVNDTAQIRAFPGENQILKSWRINNQEQAASNPLKWVIEEGTEITAVFDTPTNIRENEADARLSMFPNPACSELTIEWHHNDKDVMIQIMDMQGRLIVSRNHAASGFVIRDQISLKHVPAGVYLVRVSDGELLLTRKLIIQ